MISMPFVVSACLDLPSIQYRTEEALIGTDFDIMLCPDDLDRIDRHIAFVEDMLDAQSDEKIEIYLYASQPRGVTGASVVMIRGAR